MSKAIKINLRKATEDDSFDTSRFFGAPVIPEEWEERFDDDVVFLGQINLEEIARFDEENRLPHKGWLYFFVDTAKTPYKAIVEYYDGDPEIIVEDFNECVPDFEHLNEDYIATFEPCDEFDPCTRLFGGPTMPLSEFTGTEPLLLQYDPYEEAGFMQFVDGFIYIFCDTKGEKLGKPSYYVEERT